MMLLSPAAMVLFWKGTPIVFLCVMLGLLIADLFKRHLLSRSAVYAVSMLVVPMAMISAVGAPIVSFISSETSFFVNLVVFGNIGLALMIASAVIYIRGHVKPVIKADFADDTERYRLCASKRLISVGIAGNILYGIFLAVSFVEVSAILYLVGDSVVSSGMGVKEMVILPFFLLFLLLVPIANIIVIFLLMLAAAEFVTLGITALMTMLFVLLIANGCIRYILTTDKTKGKKALWIFLSLIPAFNFIYGISCLAKINKRLKETQFS